MQTPFFKLFYFDSAFIMLAKKSPAAGGTFLLHYLNVL
ncbi:Hypothetical protein ACI5QM_00257 [Bacillus subtilis]